MNTTKSLKLGVIAAVSVSSLLTSRGDDLDTFDTFTSTHATAASGFVLGLGAVASGTTAIDAAENIFSTGDSDFSALTRRVTLTAGTGVANPTSGNTDVYNGTAPSTAQGFLKWGNDGKNNSTVSLLYTFNPFSYPAGKNLDTGLFAQFELDWNAFEFGTTFDITVTSSVGLEGSKTITGVSVPVTGNNTLTVVPFGSFAGANSVWNSVRTIEFTLRTSYADLDIQLDNIAITNPNVPEASTTIPAVGFAGALGFVAWRRRISR